MSDHGHPSSVSLIFSSFILMISSRPYVIVVSNRIGEILKATLVNGQIFSTALCKDKRRREQIPVALIPKSRALGWHGNQQKCSTRGYGRGEQSYWSESDGPKQTSVLARQKHDSLSRGVPCSVLVTLDLCVFENVRELLEGKRPCCELWGCCWTLAMELHN